MGDKNAEASSEPVASQSKTPKSLKPKRTISKRSSDVSLTKTNKLNKTSQIQGEKSKKKKKIVPSSNPVKGTNEKEDTNLNETPQIQGEQRMEKGKSVPGSKKVKITHEKEEKNLKIRETKQNDIINGEQDQKSQENSRDKEKYAGLQKKQHNEKNEEKSFGMENERRLMSKEKYGGPRKNQNTGKNKEKHHESEEKKTYQMNKQDHGELGQSQHNEKKKDKLGGLIFMCNKKTKPDCFRYHVMGVPFSKKDLVLGIKPGLKLFLYDFDLKLMYGIYRASSSGGMKLEPAAFGGAFPVQVRFKIYQDCYPLPESVFKRAIKENYNEKQKFKTELTVEQVNKLTKLFRPAEVQSLALLDREVDNNRARESYANLSRESLPRVPCSYGEGNRYRGRSNENDQHLAYREVKEDISQDYYPSEKEYRTYGLRRERKNFNPPRSHITPTLEPYSSSYERDHLLANQDALYRAYVPAPEQAPSHDPHLVTEKQYQTYSFAPKWEPESSTRVVTTSLASTLDLYAKDPYYTSHRDGSSLDPYRSTSRREEVPVVSYSLGGKGDSYPSMTDRLETRETYLPRGEAYPSRIDRLEARETYLSRGETYPSQIDGLEIRENYLPRGLYPFGIDRLETRETYPTREETFPSGIDHLEMREIYPSHTDLSRRGVSFLTESSHLGRIDKNDVGTLYSSYASGALSDCKQPHKYQGGEAETSLAPVSSRYSFAGPSLSRR